MFQNTKKNFHLKINYMKISNMKKSIYGIYVCCKAEVSLFFLRRLSACCQVTSLCTSSCPQDCFRPGNESCIQLCDGCACAPPAIADYITGRCVQPEQCTGKPKQLAVTTMYISLKNS